MKYLTCPKCKGRKIDSKDLPCSNCDGKGKVKFESTPLAGILEFSDININKDKSGSHRFAQLYFDIFKELFNRTHIVDDVITTVKSTIEQLNKETGESIELLEEANFKSYIQRCNRILTLSLICQVIGVGSWYEEIIKLEILNQFMPKGKSRDDIISSVVSSFYKSQNAQHESLSNLSDMFLKISKNNESNINNLTNEVNQLKDIIKNLTDTKQKSVKDKNKEK